MIYFDNAATTMHKPACVAEAVAAALGSFGGVGRGVHGASISAGLGVYEARAAVAELLGAPGAGRVSFTMNVTMALNIAIASLLPSGGVAVTTAASHNSVLRPLFAARDARGCEVRVAAVRADGSLDYADFEEKLAGANLAVITHAANLTGDVYDVARQVEAAHAAGVPVVLDAAQTAGCFPLNMEALGVDVLCFTGHKALFGPQGTGGLCVARGLELAPLLEGGSGTHSFEERHPVAMPEGLEAGTMNAHGLAGLAAGVRWVAEQGVEQIAAHEAALVARFEEGVAALPGVHVLGGGAEGRTGVVAIAVDGRDSSQVADYLSCEYEICTRAGAHCAPLMHRALGTEATGATRFSFSPFNTFDEIDLALSALEKM